MPIQTHWHCKDRRFLQSRMAEDLQRISGESCGSSNIFSYIFVILFCFWKSVVALRGAWMPQVYGCPDRTDVLLTMLRLKHTCISFGPRPGVWNSATRRIPVYSYKIQQTRMQKCTCHPEIVYFFRCFTCFTLKFHHLPSSTAFEIFVVCHASHARYGRNHRLPGRGANPRPGLPACLWRTLLEQTVDRN